MLCAGKGKKKTNLQHLYQIGEGMTGLDVVSAIMAFDNETPVFVHSGRHDIGELVVKSGAAGFILKDPKKSVDESYGVLLPYLR